VVGEKAPFSGGSQKGRDKQQMSPLNSKYKDPKRLEYRNRPASTGRQNPDSPREKDQKENHNFSSK